MSGILLFVPVTFLTAFLIIWAFSRFTLGFAPKADNLPSGKLNSYACGEDYKTKKIEPDYKTFFPFAIFFTVIHVSGLMIATLAAAHVTYMTTIYAVLYVLGIASVFAVLYSD
jgi:NADH-quinone oxidoreductase subunit A